MSSAGYPTYRLSGLDWMKEIPSHWEVKELRYLGDALIGLTYDPSDVVAEGEGTLVLRSSNIQNGKITLDDNVYVSTKIPARANRQRQRHSHLLAEWESGTCGQNRQDRRPCGGQLLRSVYHRLSK